LLAKTAKEASELSGRPVDWFKMDVTKKDEIAQTVKAIIDKHGRIDVLVNNAGVSTMNPVVDMTEEEWDFCMNVNAKDPFLVTKAGVAGFEPTTLCLGNVCHKIEVELYLLNRAARVAQLLVLGNRATIVHTVQSRQQLTILLSRKVRIFRPISFKLWLVRVSCI